MRTRYLLCYDVRDEVRLRRVRKLAEAFGYRLQYSVFVCDLSAVERALLVSNLRDLLNVRIDAAVLVNLGLAGPSSRRRLQWVSDPQQIHDSYRPTIV